MKKHSPKFLLIIVAFTCFMLGLFSVWLKSETVSNQTTQIESASTSKQTTVLIVGVDDLGKMHPQLMAVWYAAFQLPEKDIFLLGLPISGPADTSNNSLRSIFDWHPSNGISPAFIQALHSQTSLNPDFVIVLDNHAFSTGVDYLGGIQFNGGQLDGSQVIAMFNFLENEPSALLSTQKRVLLALAQQAENVGITPDLTPLTSLIPDHAHISSDLSVLLTRTIPLLPIVPDAVFIDTLQTNSP